MTTTATATRAPDTDTSELAEAVLRSRQIRVGIALARAHAFKQASDFEPLTLELGDRVAGGLLAENLTAAGKSEVIAKRCVAAGWGRL